MSAIAPGVERRTGLDAAGVAARRARDGRNVLPTAKTVPAWRHLLGQMTHFFAALL